MRQSFVPTTITILLFYSSSAKFQNQLHHTLSASYSLKKQIPLTTSVSSSWVITITTIIIFTAVSCSSSIQNLSPPTAPLTLEPVINSVHPHTCYLLCVMCFVHIIIKSNCNVHHHHCHHRHHEYVTSFLSTTSNMTLLLAFTSKIHCYHY